MQISCPNDVKLYNLSAGRSIPEWISDRKRRKLEQKNSDIRRRIQLIQDFEMPDISSTVNVSKDGRYIFATGTYKPVLKCFDVDQLSLKFSRGLDADVVKMLTLSEDFSKFILLEEERYLELHVAYGRYFRFRIPNFGHDMSFCREVSNVYVIGSGCEIFRLDLEEGKFLDPLITSSPSLTCCEFNNEHQLFLCGTSDGHVEAWDHRSRSRSGLLDCALHLSATNSDSFSRFMPKVSALKFKNGVNFAIGTDSGHILTYDIRSNRPLLIKDHQTDLEIRRLEFVPEKNLVLSMDSRLMKIWNELNGAPLAAIEPGIILNDFCRYPDSGLFFFANEAPAILQYFMPAIGIAPKWCSYLETITEELEEIQQPAIYDDYKFLTHKQLEETGLSHLIGSSLLRAYMHGYFIDVRLYNKARLFMQPFALENFKKNKIMERIDDERSVPSFTSNAEVLNTKTVNKEFAKKLLSKMEQQLNSGDHVKNKKKIKEDKVSAKILTDDRFKSLFVDKDFVIDESSEQFQRLDVSEKFKNKKVMRDDEDEGRSMDNENKFEKDSGYRRNEQEIIEEGTAELSVKTREFEFIELDAGEDVRSIVDKKIGTSENKTQTFGTMRREFAHKGFSEIKSSPLGGRQITFKLKTGQHSDEKSSTERRQKRTNKR